MLPSYLRPSRETLLSVARVAERLGFDSVWTNSHTVVPASFKPRYPYSENGVPSWNAKTDWADAMTTLGFIAAATERVRLGTAVVPLIITDPITLAKQAATVDLLSDGSSARSGQMLRLRRVSGPRRKSGCGRGRFARWRTQASISW